MSDSTDDVHKSFLEKCELENQLTVDGFLREIEAVLNQTIPRDINKICFEFYHSIKERFDPELHAETITISKTFDSIKSGYGGGAAYLCNVADKGYHHWKFKVIEHVPGCLLYVGIKKIERKLRTGFSECVYDSISIFAINAGLGCLRGNFVNKTGKYCPRCKTGDIIDMKLDLDNNTMEFLIDGQNNDEPRDIDHCAYRAVVAMNEHNESIQLLNYQYKE